MPQSFVPFNEFIPDGGDFGPQLAKAENVLPVHGSFRPLNQKATISQENDGPVTGAYVHVYQQSRAVQFIRPDTDSSVGSWQTSDASAQLFAVLNETAPDDAKFIFVGAAPSGAAVKLGLSNPSATSGVSHFVRWRYRVPVLTTSGWTMKAELMQGTTVIATDTATGSAVTGWVQRELTLSAPEIAAITDYTALFVRFTATAPGSTQLLAPNADTAAGGWVNQASSGVNLFQSIDESSPSDTDYVQSGVLAPGGSTSIYAGTITAGVDPLTRAGHILHLRYRGLNAGVTIKARLKNGATLVKEIVLAAASTSFTTLDQALSTTEAALLAPGYAGTLELEGSYPTDIASTVSQTLVPIATLASANNFLVGAATEWEALADADNTTYITNDGIGPSDGLLDCEVQLGPGVDPLSSLGHVLYCRAYIPTGQSAQAQLFEGSIMRAVLGMVGVSSDTDYTYTLTAAEANSITDYSALSINIHGSGYGNFFYRTYLQIPQVRKAVVSWAQLEVPAAQRGEVSWSEMEVPDASISYRGDIPTIIAGTKLRLWEVTDSKFIDLSKAGNYAGGGSKPASWCLCSFGNNIIATNYVDPVQIREDNTGAFKDLITSTLKPKARFVCAFRDQIMLGGINLSGHFDDEIWLSGVDDAKTFDVGNPQIQSDYQRLVSCPGGIMGLVGGDFVLAFKRHSIHRIDWTGGPQIFRVSDVTASIGSPNPRSIVQADGMTYFWGGNSFYRTNGYDIPEKVGGDILGRFLTDTDFSEGAIARFEPQEIAIEDQLLTGHYAFHAGVIIWTYQGKTDSNYRHRRAVIYNIAMDSWTAWNLPEGVDLSLLIQLPTITGSSTWLLRDTIGFDWDGTTTHYFRFSAASTYPALLSSRKQAMGYDAEERPTTSFLKGVIPIFTLSGNAVARTPNMSITVRTSLDPRFVTNVISKAADASLANEAFQYPYLLDGTWWNFQVTIPSMSDEMVVAFKGLWLDWQKGGRSGG